MGIRKVFRKFYAGLENIWVVSKLQALCITGMVDVSAVVMQRQVIKKLGQWHNFPSQPTKRYHRVIKLAQRCHVVCKGSNKLYAHMLTNFPETAGTVQTVVQKASMEVSATAPYVRMQYSTYCCYVLWHLMLGCTTGPNVRICYTTQCQDVPEYCTSCSLN